MPSENLELVKRAFEAYRGGGTEAIGPHLHPDFEMQQLPGHPLAGTYLGPEAAGASIDDWVGTFDEFNWEVDEFVDAGDHVVVGLRERGRARGSSATVDHLYGMVFTLREGKIVRLRWFETKEAACAAAGLPAKRAEARPTT